MKSKRLNLIGCGLEDCQELEGYDAFEGRSATLIIRDNPNGVDLFAKITNRGKVYFEEFLITDKDLIRLLNAMHKELNRRILER